MKSKYSRDQYSGLKGFHSSHVFLNTDDIASWESNANSYLDSLYGVLDNPIGDITSRDQIINPFNVVDSSKYAMTRRGQALYNQHLEQAKLIAQQQEAKYQEWYQSPEQVIARERAAGRNPDLIDPMSSESGSVVMPQNGAFDNIPTNGELVLNSLSSISNVFSSVSGIMNTISGIGLASAQKDLIKEQADGQFISNVGTFSTLASNAISDKLAKALEEDNFDMAKFFDGDFTDIFSSLSPSDDPRYLSAFNRVLNHSKKVHSDAYASLGEHENRRKLYLEQLASSYYSPDDDEMTGQLSIVVRSNEQLHLITNQLSKDIADIKSQYISNIDANAAADSLNAQNEYNDDYYSAMNGEIMAKFNQAIKSYEAVVNKASADVYHYLNKQFNSPLNIFNPSRKSRIGWQILAGSELGWEDHMYATGYSEFTKILNNLDASTQNYISNAVAATQNAATNAQNAATNARDANTRNIALWLNFATGMANAWSGTRSF